MRSDKAMRQCFPQRWADEYPDLIPGLRDMVVSTYNDGVPVRGPSPSLSPPSTTHRTLLVAQLAWNDLVRTAGFVEKANELDRLIAEAQARKDAGEEPRNLYQCANVPLPRQQDGTDLVVRLRFRSARTGWDWTARSLSPPLPFPSCKLPSPPCAKSAKPYVPHPPSPPPSLPRADNVYRAQLANKNAETYARIAALSQTVSAQETQNEEILTQFTEVRHRPLLAIFASPARPRCAHQTGWVRAVRKGVEGD